MKDFTLLFRIDHNPTANLSPAQMQEVLQKWMNWMGGIAAQNKLVEKGNRLGLENAKIVKANKEVIDGPYTEIKEFVSGYLIVKANTVDEAVEIAKGCPILSFGGNVEVREITNPVLNN